VDGQVRKILKKTIQQSVPEYRALSRLEAATAKKKSNNETGTQ
jgi:hypothetical protein